MNKKYRIKKFVQKTLGCTCPDKVFAEIEEEPLSLLSSSRARSIIIGGRLLLYIWNIKGPHMFQEDLLAMLEAGKRERDGRGLNRFRAVLAVDNDLQHYEKEAESYFSQYADRDDRMNIHVVSTADLKDL
jgi:hypothetical protein